MSNGFGPIGDVMDVESCTISDGQVHNVSTSVGIHVSEWWTSSDSGAELFVDVENPVHLALTNAQALRLAELLLTAALPALPRVTFVYRTGQDTVQPPAGEVHNGEWFHRVISKDDPTQPYWEPCQVDGDDCPYRGEAPAPVPYPGW
jgi:hypothetical protein